MTTDQTDRAEHLRIRAHNLKRELNELAEELDFHEGKNNRAYLFSAAYAVEQCCNQLLDVVDRDKLPRTRPVSLNPFDSLHTAICTTSRDMSVDKLDAWLYAVVVGWDNALSEVAADFGWSEETQARLRGLHEVFNAQKELHKS